MDLNYLAGQRPADVRKLLAQDIKDDGTLMIRQNKTNKYLKILLNSPDGARNEPGKVLDRIRSRSSQVRSFFLVATPGRVAPLTYDMLRMRFDAARAEAAYKAEKAGEDFLADRIRKFQFRDIRPKAASDIENIEDASKLLGHTKQEITEKVYRCVGETVNPTK